MTVPASIRARAAGWRATRWSSPVIAIWAVLITFFITAGPILLAGAPRIIAIVNGTIAAAIGLGLQQWLIGLAVWASGHSIAVFAARRDPDFAAVLVRHLRQKGYLAC